jgi:hypothetical protein
MNTLEDRVRAALDAHAEEFSADPDAWARIRARSLTAQKPRVRWRRRRPGRFLIPAAAAATVVAIVLAVTATVHGVAGRSAGGPTGATPSSPGPGASSSSGAPITGVPPEFLTDYPPVSAVLAMPVTGPGGQRAVDYSWLAYTTQSWWPDQLQGLQSCGGAVFKHGSSWYCVPLPQLGAGRLASITLSHYLPGNTGPLVLQGLAINQVASVTAVLPDGQVIPGVVKTGRGFPDKAWAVVAPADEKTRKPASGVRLVFRDASGAVLASLGAVAPPHAQVPEPDSGGIAVFTNPEGSGSVSYTMNAYLIKGYVGFWLRPSPGLNGYLAPRLAAGPPALAGFTLAPTDLYRASAPEAVGYAHADVARVVLHLPGGRSVSTSTVAAWPGSGLRLWAIRLPADVYIQGQQIPTITATGYDTAGQVVARVVLGSGI